MIEDILQDIISRVLKIEKSEASLAEYAKHYSWDSLTHVLLVSAIEERFEIKFVPHEIVSLLNLATAVELTKAAIERKGNEN